MKKSFNFNRYGVKESTDQYRNIKGVHFIHWTSDTSIFAKEKSLAKIKGLKTRIIKGELYIEKK